MPLLHHDPGLCGKRDRTVCGLGEQRMHGIRLQGTGYSRQNRVIGKTKSKLKPQGRKTVFQQLARAEGPWMTKDTKENKKWQVLKKQTGLYRLYPVTCHLWPCLKLRSPKPQPKRTARLPVRK